MLSPTYLGLIGLWAQSLAAPGYLGAILGLQLTQSTLAEQANHVPNPSGLSQCDF